MQRHLWTFLFEVIGIGFFCVMLASCLPAVNAPSTLPTILPTLPSLTPSPTIVWFPPTATLTPLPTTTLAAEPTLGTPVEYGDLVILDDFSNPEKWQTGLPGSGRISVEQNELTLAINRPNGYLTSLRQGSMLVNYYLEITASPTICRGGDEYGLLLRVSPSMDFYRFSLTCDGQIRVDKFFGGKASSPQGLTMSGAVPRGAPSQTRLGVLVDGRELSFYINGEYQFSVRDPSLPTGGLGVFARAAGQDAVTVNFSDLMIFDIPK